MSAAIGPGDWVECVSARRTHCLNTTADLLVAGRLYLVTGVGVDSKVEIVWLSGIRSHDATGGFGLFRFRPIYRPNAKLIADLLTKVPAERVPA